jgi:hypothetical protein
MHPRDFNFGRTDIEVPAAKRGRKASPVNREGSDSDDDDEDDEEYGGLMSRTLSIFSGVRKHPHGVGSCALSHHCWFVIGAICIMLRLFGLQVCLELVEETLSISKEALAQGFIATGIVSPRTALI